MKDDLIFSNKFLDYRKTLLEKQKINNFLETKQNNKEKSNSIFSSIIKI